MKSNEKTLTMRIGGMTCVSCENRIERKLRNTAGIKSVRVSYSAGTADVTYDASMLSPQAIAAIVEKLDYQVLSGNASPQTAVLRVAGFLAIILVLFALLQHFGILNMLVPNQLANSKMGYGMLFVIGLITSIHCIAMCGGINLSQCISKGAASPRRQGNLATFRPAFLYNFGRVISYTVIGFILGLVGMLFGGGSSTGVPVMLQGILKLIAGIFMVIMGLNMLGIFPWLRKLNPRMPKSLARNVGIQKATSKSPLLVGLLNGLMPCGPLQSMQIVALASGNPLVGGLSMFLFSLGTVPLMLGFGSLVSALGKKFTTKVMTVGAILVVVLGLAMLSQGGFLSGFIAPSMLLRIIIALCLVGVISAIPFPKPSQKTIATFGALAAAVVVLVISSGMHAPQTKQASDPVPINGTQATAAAQTPTEVQVTSTLSAQKYPNITVPVGAHVRWVINAPAKSINGCNNRMYIPAYNIEHEFTPGENVIEFTPTQEGKIDYSCWMGMIPGTITVTASGEASSDQ